MPFTEYYNDYYKKNIQNQYFQCECGTLYMKYRKTHHEKTQKHKKIMKDKL